MSEIKEEFDILKCEPKTYMTILENLSHYEAHGDTQAINVFRSLKTEMESKCNMNPIIRALNGAYTQNPTKPKPKKFTMRGFDLYEIRENKNGSLSLIPPEPEPEPPKIPDPIPECLIALAHTEKENEERRKKQTRSLDKNESWVNPKWKSSLRG